MNDLTSTDGVPSNESGWRRYIRKDCRVSTPYGVATVVAINDAYGVKVRYERSGKEDWHHYSYVTPLLESDITQ